MSGAIIPAGLPIAFGAGGGGGGGSTNVFAGDGILVTGAAGGPYTIAADFGTGALKVLQALKASVESVLGFSVAGVVKTTALGVLSSGLLLNADVGGAAGIVASKLDLTTIAQNIANTGTLANTGDVTVTGNLAVSAISQGASFRFGAAGATQTSGTGAPAAAEANGSIFQRTDGASTTTLYVRAAGAWTALGAGGSSITWAGDLAGSTDSTQVVAAITGAAGKVLVSASGNIFEWASATTAPGIRQAANTTNSATAAATTIRSASATGTTATGGALNLSSGDGTAANGVLNLQNAGTTVASVQVGTASVAALLVNSATSSSLAADFQTAATSIVKIGKDATSNFVAIGGTTATAGFFRAPGGASASTILSCRNYDNTVNVGVAAYNNGILYFGVDGSVTAATRSLDTRVYGDNVRLYGSTVLNLSTSSASLTASVPFVEVTLRTVATNAGTLTIGDTNRNTILDPAALIASFTLTMPAAPVSGQRVRVAVGVQGITTLTHSPNSGQTLNSPLAGTANGTGEWTYVSAVTTWFRTG